LGHPENYEINFHTPSNNLLKIDLSIFLIGSRQYLDP
jgi:hypothetical protein